MFSLHLCKVSMYQYIKELFSNFISELQCKVSKNILFYKIFSQIFFKKLLFLILIKKFFNLIFFKYKNFDIWKFILFACYYIFALYMYYYKKICAIYVLLEKFDLNILCTHTKRIKLNRYIIIHLT